MTFTRTLVLVPGLVFALAASAVAQQAPVSAPLGIYVAANGGATFRPSAQPEVALGVEFADSFHRNMQAYVALNYFANVMSADMTDDLEALSDSLTLGTGREWVLDGRDRGVGFTVGAKYIFGDGGLSGPYAGGGAGVINLHRYINDPVVGDVTAATLNDFGIGNAALVSSSLTRPLVEAMVGYAMEIDRVRLDFGYRYRRAFNVGETLDFSQLHVGLGVTF